jgi:hypothetical protein
MKFAPFFHLILCLSCVSLAAYANGHFSREVKRVTGDLNNDGREDLALVTQDTTADTGPYRLQILFRQPDGHYKLAVSTEDAIDPAFPDGRNGYRTGNDFDDITIINGVVTISVQLLRGHYEHKFRYQNGNFELIGFAESGSDGVGTCSSVDFNLSTGVRHEKDERCDTDQVIRNVQKKVMIRPLPRLQDFQPLQSELY